MPVALVDTTVIIHLFRKHQPALDWLAAQSDPLGIPAISWMEVVVGAANTRAQQDVLALLASFEIVHLTASDQDWAMQQLTQYQLQYAIGMHDCLIAAASHRLQRPLYTHNLKDMTLLLGDKLALQPYT